MAFDDIDTPVPESELFGEAEAAPEPEVTETDAGEVVAEDTDEPAVEADPAPEPEAEAQEEAAPARAQVIPRARFDEVNAKLHAEREEKAQLMAQLEALRKPADTPAADAVDIEALEAQHFDAILSGEKDVAVRLRAQINAEIFAQAERKALEKAIQHTTAKEERSEFDQTVAAVHQQFPFLDHASASANPEAIAEVVEWRNYYIDKGDSPATALQKAAGRVATVYAAPVQAAPVVQHTNTRKQVAIARNVAATGSQPPAQVAGIGNRAVPPLPEVKTQNDWENLKESEREALLM